MRSPSARRNREKEIDDGSNSRTDRELIDDELFVVARETEEFHRTEREASISWRTRAARDDQVLQDR